MATEAPDPKTFGSWEDAFQYPIAAVRGMERQLRNDIGSNREKLRSLVGASYRDLLGTAESIIQMDGQMQQVESYIGGMGMRCNSRLLGKKAANLRAWDNDSKATDRERYAFALQLAVLRSCPEVITRLLRTHGSVLLAAKVLVISRLLHKKISQRGHPPRYLEFLRNRLATLRRKLLTKIDRHLKSLESSESTLVEAMCAFSLATSSSSTDVLRHFHHIRQLAVSELGQREDDDKRISKSLQLVVKTLRDCQMIVPAQLALALETLKATPLIEGLDIQSLRELNLEIHQRWLGDDINSFTPYVRHDDLQKTEANRLFEQWAKTAFSSFLRDLREMVEKVESPAVVVQLRQELLELWLSNKRHSMGAGTFGVLNGIRDAFNNRFKYLIHQHTANLSDVSASINTLLEDWNWAVSDTCPPMWDDTIISMDTGSGGKVLKDELSTRACSRSEAVRIASTIYTNWLDGINSLEQLITQLQERKWADELDDMDDDDDTSEGLHNMLSEDDPHLLHKTFEDDLEESFRMLRDVINDYAKNLQTNDREETSAQKSAFLLRVWRDIANRLPSIYRDIEPDSPFIPLFQTQVSKTVLQNPIAHCDKRISKCLQHKRLQARILWEGDPQLPVLPSPWAFRLLHETVKSMTKFGVDIWTPRATNILKQQMRDALAPIVKKLPELPRQVNGHDANGEPQVDDEEKVSRNPEEGAEVDPQDRDDEKDDGETRDGEKKKSEEEMKTQSKQKLSSAQKINGDHPSKPSGPSEEVVRDSKTQRLFDAVYLDYALSVKSMTTTPDDPDNEITPLPDLFDSAQSNILNDLQMEDVQQWNRNLDRMRKDAGAYWKRTELLFALLA
ncbi:MAG: hypothetical protein L6R38_008394 [Xanthoria sp. 2 TBL-2021]|nr:MAG: hypothetical protein L6R38_008394 [Xanthoria sp. 2 TBL-2021]